VAAGVELIVLGCSELRLGLVCSGMAPEPEPGVPLLDPIELGAEHAVAVAYGELPLFEADAA
jgi:hypothetical protein